MSDFEKLVESHRARLRLHCYRMLGSASDAEDMVQETLARAFRSQSTLQDPALARAWLYRIATNVCIDELTKRPRRLRGLELREPHDPDLALPPAKPDDEWIEPAPSAWSVAEDPGSQYALRESVALAFVAALQVLTPAQRAVLLLRDVVGLSAEEAAGALESSVSAVNSTLHRARTALEARVGPRGSWSPEAGAGVDRALLERYLEAWESGDLARIISLLHAEATLSMPPIPAWLRGRDAIERFLTNRVRRFLEARAFRGTLLEASGQSGVAFYRYRDDGLAHLFAIHLVGAREGLIGSIDHNTSARAHAVFIEGGLPQTFGA